MQTNKLNPAEGLIVPGTVIDEYSFNATIPTGMLFHLAPDPRITEDEEERAQSALVQSMFEMRREVQRLFEGEKARNVEPYANYLLKVLINKEAGDVPSIILWGESELAFELVSAPLGYIQVPYTVKLIAIDGETQLAARYLANSKNPKMLGAPVTVKVCHGRPVEWAKQAFHDLNVFGVVPNAAKAIGMDMRDPATALARELEAKLPFFHGRVDKERRQLRRADEAVLTITALRSGVVTLSEGITGVKYGTGTVPIHSARIPQVRDTAVEWFGAIAERFGSAIEDRLGKVAGAPAVIAALGAMGHELLNYADPARRSEKQKELLAKLEDINWEKGKAWEGIAGKFTAKGKFSIGGTKETVYAVFQALNEPTSAGGQQVRGSGSPIPPGQGVAEGPSATA